MSVLKYDSFSFLSPLVGLDWLTKSKSSFQDYYHNPKENSVNSFCFVTFLSCTELFLPLNDDLKEFKKTPKIYIIRSKSGSAVVSP